MVSFVGVGTCTLTANAAATSDYSAVTGNPQSFTVNPSTPTIDLATSGTPSAYGTTVTFTATVSSGESGNVVTFYDGGAGIGTAPINGNTATYATSNLGDGTHSITAYLPASGDYTAATSSPVAQTVVGGPGGNPTTVYTNSITYDDANRVTGYTDSIMGTWANIGYDSLNRMIQSQNTVAPPSGADYAGKYLCWSYDAFGNRTAQVVQSAACPTPESSVPQTAKYTANNQVSWVQDSAPNGYGYDASGDETQDSVNQYLYDGEGRVCAVENTLVGTKTGYIYNAEGIRVAKGTLTEFTCDLTQNHFQETSDEVLDSGGEQAAEYSVDASSNVTWQHSNVWVGSQLIATYDTNGLHFYANDWQGTRRVQTDAAGVVEQSCQSLPYGDKLVCTGDPSTPTEHHFTGKESDVESGNDYFEARYYSHDMGRFLTPDWDAKPVTVPYASFGDPQTLNLYAYVENGPLNRVDATGHAGLTPLDSGGINAEVFPDCTVLECPPETDSNGFDEVVPAFATDADRQAEESADSGTAASNAQEQSQQQNGATLPSNPSGLGSGWKDVTPQGGKNPKIPKRYRGPKGTEIEFDPGDPNKSPKKWGGRDHWHEVGPDGRRKDGHLAPGSPMPGPDGDSAPAERSMMDRMRSITPSPILKLGPVGIIIYILIDEGSRLYPPRNLAPVP
jgi:RHS repeat-associated protein